MSSGDREGDLIAGAGGAITRIRVTFDEGRRHLVVQVRVRQNRDEAVWFDLAPLQARDLAGRLQSAATWVESLA